MARTVKCVKLAAGDGLDYPPFPVHSASASGEKRLQGSLAAVAETADLARQREPANLAMQRRAEYLMDQPSRTFFGAGADYWRSGYVPPKP